VGIGDGLGDNVGCGVEVIVGWGVGVWELGVGLAEGDRLGVGVDGLGVGVGEGEGDGLGVGGFAVGVGEGEGVGEGDGLGVRVGEGEGLGLTVLAVTCTIVNAKIIDVIRRMIVRFFSFFIFFLLKIF
jgi:hypothetical protein